VRTGTTVKVLSRAPPVILSVATGVRNEPEEATNSLLRYEPGKRSGAWIKIKLDEEQEFVIGGYAEPEGGGKYFGALLVGFCQVKNLKFAGRVGTGFSDKLLRSLFSDLEKTRIQQCPFSNVPAVSGTEKLGECYSQPFRDVQTDCQHRIALSARNFLR
jgi:hypothetical protein